jgi:hypothetical protein
MQFTIAVFLAVAGLLRTAAGLGINCRGSSQCIGQGGAMQVINDHICAMDASTEFADGAHIACDGNTCAFLQDVGTNSFNAGQLCTLSEFLIVHGCTSCGSIPTGFPASNGMCCRAQQLSQSLTFVLQTSTLAN